MDTSDQRSPDSPEVSAPVKKPWAPPMLIVHGNVEEITKNVGPGGGDLPFGTGSTV
jgi:hypothetical protein